MKIEKGKLYYNPILRKVELSKEDINNDIFSDKIAVHCPNVYDRAFMSYKFNLSGSLIGLDGSDWYFDLVSNGLVKKDSEVWNSLTSHYHIITIDQFKEFYPEVETSDTSIKSDENVHNNVHPAHYTNKGIQPIDYIEANKLDFNEGNVIKYVTRYKDKNGLEDLKKAKFYLERLIQSYAE